MSKITDAEDMLASAHSLIGAILLIAAGDSDEHQIHSVAMVADEKIEAVIALLAEYQSAATATLSQPEGSSR